MAVVADVPADKVGEFGLVTSSVCDSVKYALSFVGLVVAAYLLVMDPHHFLAQTILNTILKNALTKIIYIINRL